MPARDFLTSSRGLFSVWFSALNQQKVHIHIARYVCLYLFHSRVIYYCFDSKFAVELSFLANVPIVDIQKYSGTSINGHLVKAVTYCNVASIAGPERPPYLHNYCFIHKAVTSIIRITATQSRPRIQFSIQIKLRNPAGVIQTIARTSLAFQLLFLRPSKLQLLNLKQ